MKLIEISPGGRRRVTALLIKEFFQIVRDPSSILISVVMPIIFIFLYGTGVSLDLDHLRLGVVVEESSPDVQTLVTSFTDSPYFDVTLVRDRRELLDDMNKGAIRGMVVIPFYFTDFLNRQNTVAPIQVIADGSETNTANFVQNYVQGAFGKWVVQEALNRRRLNTEDLVPTPSLNVQKRFWYNEELESRNFLVTGSLAITMTLIGTLLTSLVVSREWERGTMEGLMSTPMRIVEFIFSKLMAYFILGMISMTISVAISLLVYRIPFRGSFLVLGLISSVFLVCALGTGLLISTYAKNQLVASQASLVAGFMPSYILSGFIFEITSMPLPIQWLTYLIPARYFVSCLETIFLVGNVWPLFIKNLIPMILIGVILFVLTAFKTVKRLD